MTCGIYILRFENTDKVYIGQSIHIEKRIATHMYRLRGGVSSIKLQGAYNIYGLPNYEILAECTKEELNDFENETIETFDSYHNGFNSRDDATTGQGLQGELHPNSIFSNEQVIDVMYTILAQPGLSYQNVSVLTGTNKSLVTDIASGKRHSWLKDVYPDDYNKLITIDKVNGKNSAINRGKIYPPLLCPKGLIYNVTNVNAFAKEHGLHTGHLNEVLNGKNKSTKGWKLVGPERIELPSKG